MQWRYRLISLLCGCFLLSGCFGPVKHPPVKVYTLSLSSQNTRMTHRDGPVLLVTMPTAAPGYQSDAMVYMQHPYQLNTFSYSRWTAPPAEILEPLITQSLQNAKCFGAVVSAPFTGETQFTLNTKLLKLQQVFLPEGASCVEMAIQVDLIDNTTHHVVGTRTFETTVDAAASNPYAGVEATNQATWILLQRMKQFVCAKIK